MTKKKVISLWHTKQEIFFLIVLAPEKSQTVDFVLLRYLSSALAKLIPRARGLRPQVCAFPVPSISASFKAECHLDGGGQVWGWGKDLKTTKPFPDFRLRGHPVAAPCLAGAREASSPSLTTLFLILFPGLCLGY